MADPFSLLSSDIIERYEPIRVIGHGSFSSVLEARARRSGLKVAIKHIPALGNGRAAFFKEVRHLMDLAHPNIVRCIDLCSAEPTSSALVLEFAGGGTLRSVITLGTPWTFADAWPVLVDVARGLRVAHEHNIVHRDLKPENILRFPEAVTRYKIADFGIARAAGLLGGTIGGVGSPAYMAPEQFYEDVDGKCDIYALGVIAFELLHGRTPFEGAPAALFKAHLEAPVPLAPDLDPEAARLILHMMAKRPADRPTADELLTVLAAAGDRMGLASPIENLAADEDSSESTALSGADVFGDAFGVAGGSKTALDPEPSQATHVNAASFFDDAFDSAPPIEFEGREGRITAPGPSAICGQFEVVQRWSRATESRTRALLNPDDGSDLLVIAETGIYEMQRDATRGARLDLRDFDLIGTPSNGTMLVRSGNRLRVLHHGAVGDVPLTLSGPIDAMACAPGLDAIAVRVGNVVHYHDASGRLLWSGELAQPEGTLMCGFDGDDRLLVLAIDSNDASVSVYDRGGEQVGMYPTGGTITAASRCRAGSGCWVLAESADGIHAMRVSAGGILASGGVLAVSVRDIIGGRGWIAGSSESGELYVVDPIAGEAIPLPITGTVLSYEQGADEEDLIVLEERGDHLRYITAFSVQLAT